MWDCSKRMQPQNRLAVPYALVWRRVNCDGAFLSRPEVLPLAQKKASDRGRRWEKLASDTAASRDLDCDLATHTTEAGLHSSPSGILEFYV